MCNYLSYQVRQKLIYLSILIVTLTLLNCKAFATAPISLVAAENVYGEVASELGGPYVNVVSILNKPSQDPHMFSLTPSTAKAISSADIVVYNGLNYDPWIQFLLNVKEQQKKRIIIDVAQLMNIQPPSNPHLWYLPETIPVFANKLVTLLQEYDPEHKAYYNQRLKDFLQQYQAIYQLLNQMKQNFQGTAIIATEPLFNYMAEEIGLSMHGQNFQLSMMNDVPPVMSQIREFENDLKQHTVAVLIFNNQVMNPLTQRMLSIAQQEHIPIVGMSEMLPLHTTYIKWMLVQLSDLKASLERSKNGSK